MFSSFEVVHLIQLIELITSHLDKMQSDIEMPIKPMIMTKKNGNGQLHNEELLYFLLFFVPFSVYWCTKSVFFMVNGEIMICPMFVIMWVPATYKILVGVFLVWWEMDSYTMRNFYIFFYSLFPFLYIDAPKVFFFHGRWWNNDLPHVCNHVGTSYLQNTFLFIYPLFYIKF